MAVTCVNVHSHSPVVLLAGNLPAGCRLAAGAIHYYAPLPAERSPSTTVSVEYWNSSLSLVKTGYFDFDIELLISLVEARPALWDKTDDIYKRIPTYSAPGYKISSPCCPGFCTTGITSCCSRTYWQDYTENWMPLEYSVGSEVRNKKGTFL